jgi:translation initiation factor eIF-2B subunit beta
MSAKSEPVDLGAILHGKVYHQYNDLIIRLKRGALLGSYSVAKQTALLLRLVIGHTRWENVESLIQILRAVGRGLVSAQPVELAVGNIVRRVLFIVRQEYERLVKEMVAKGVNESIEGVSPGKRIGEQESLYNKSKIEDYTIQVKGLRPSIIEAIQEELTELENLYEPIAEQAQRTIHAGEVIFTYGKSRTIEEFLKAANSKKNLNFEVFVPEAAPSFAGHDMARALSKDGIHTTVINDSAIFAMMARVNKVIIPCHAVMANGGLIAHAGTHAVCIAAKLYECPVVCVTGLYKLSPLYPHDQDTFNVDLSPHEVLAFEDADNADKVDVANPRFDYIPPELVNLYVTNFSVVPSHRSGSHQPSYIYRLLAEYYCPDDYNL